MEIYCVLLPKIFYTRQLDGIFSYRTEVQFDMHEFEKGT